MVNFKEIYHFSTFERGPTFTRGGGGPTFSAGGGGSNCFIPVENHITCDFPGGSGPSVAPSGSALDMSRNGRTLRTDSAITICKNVQLEYVQNALVIYIFKNR